MIDITFHWYWLLKAALAVFWVFGLTYVFVLIGVKKEPSKLQTGIWAFLILIGWFFIFAVRWHLA